MSAKKLLSSDQDLLMNLYSSGASLLECGRRFNVSHTTCKNYLKKLGVPLRTAGPPRVIVPYNKRKEIVFLYTSGLGVHRIKYKVHLGVKVILRVLKEEGLSIRSVGGIRVYAVDEQFFDNIDSEEKAYWLGFISADGGITSRSLRLDLQRRDKLHLEKLKDSIRSNHPVVDGTNNAGRPISSLYINSKYLVKSLYALGVTPKKTFIITPCTSIPSGLERHYWRGLVDGDGHLSQYIVKDPECRPYTTWTIGYSGNLSMVGGFLDFIIRMGVNTKAKPYSGKTTNTIGLSGVPQCQKVATLLYQNSTLYLDRKKELADKLLNTPTGGGWKWKRERQETLWE